MNFFKSLFGKSESDSRPKRSAKSASTLTKLTLSNGMEFMPVPAGKFIMGSKDSGLDDEKPQHTVDIPYAYWMARYPITNEQYSRVYSQ